MVKNYLKIAWRNLLKHKSFSLINILGLAIGIATCIIIFTYVNYELTYDQYNPNADRIARITLTLKTPEADMAFATTPFPLADALKREYPEVQSAARLQPTAAIIKSNNELFKENGFYLADPNLFSVFSFSFKEGSAASSLKNPEGIVLTETTAKKYFPRDAAHGNGSVIGKRLVCNGKELLVTGIVADRPANSDISINALLSTDFSKFTSWMDEDFSVYTFILFKEKPDLKNFTKKIALLSTKYVQPELDAAGATKYHGRFELEPLKDVHFSQAKLVDTPKGNKQFNYIFSLLAVFILLIALLNYINLSTAKATERAKEVGIRKVSGALRLQLMRQFLFESFFLISIAWLAAIGLALLGIPFFNKLLNTKLSIDWRSNAWFMAGTFLITVLLAGLYPAFVLSNFKPVKVLKGNWRHSFKGILLRKAITITQFAIAAALIMGTTVIYQQMKYIEHKNLGFSKDQLLNIYMPIDSASRPAVASFYDALRQRPEVHGITAGSGLQQEGIPMATTFAEADGKKREFVGNYYFIDEQFLPLLKIQLLEGRNLSEKFATDKNEGFLVNEAFVSNMGWKSGLGKSVEGWGKKGKVVGVVKNFYYKSLHNIVEPLAMIYNTFPVSTIMVKIRPEDLKVVRESWKKQFAALPFEYSFLDDVLNKQYEKDRMTMDLFNDFTVLAIIVSCLGLFGLVSLITVQRTKEIGIRKVLGANLRQLLALLSMDFMKLVSWALLIALPLAGIAMNKWLSSYAYHIALSWWFFLIPLLIIPCIALLVISREVVKAALTNPVNTLRSE